MTTDYYDAADDDDNYEDDDEDKYDDDNDNKYDEEEENNDMIAFRVYWH